MNPTVLKVAKFMAQRPKDRTIRLLHIVSGIIIIQLLWYADSRSILDIPFVATLEAFQEKNIHLGLMGLGLILVLRGLIPWCLLKHRTIRIIQTTIGILLIVIGGPIMDPMVRETLFSQNQDTQEFSIAVGPIVQKTSHPGSILILFGILWILVGATGKGTTVKCLRYKEVVKKIRV